MNLVQVFHISQCLVKLIRLGRPFVDNPMSVED